MSNPSKKLTAKQELFCLEYLKDLNGSAAAVRAGYSKKTARTIAGQLMQKTEVLERIELLMADRADRLRVSTDWIVEQWKTIAQDDIKNYMDLSVNRSGSLKVKWKDLKEVDTRNISELVIEKGVVKMKRYSRETALQNLARHKGMFDNNAKSAIERILLEAYASGAINDAHLQKIADLIVAQTKKDNE